MKPILAILFILFTAACSNPLNISEEIIMGPGFSGLTKHIHLREHPAPDSCCYRHQRIGDNKFGPADYTLSSFLIFRDSLALAEFLDSNRLQLDKAVEPHTNAKLVDDAKEMHLHLNSITVTKSGRTPDHILGPYKGGGGIIFMIDNNILYISVGTN